MAEVNLTLGDPIEVKVSPAEGATNVSVSPAPQNLVQVQAAIATNGLQGADGAGVPTDPPGAAGQALVKNTAVANDTDWAYIDKLHINVRNKTGATIPAGSVVYASGLQGEDILIDLADASDASKMPAIGFTYEDIGDNNKGDIISAGVLVKNITVDDAGTADVGDTMYVSPATPGGITTVRPSDAAHKVQNVGIALKVNGNNNQVTKFKVSAIDRVNDVPNLEDGHFFLGGAPGRISEYQLPTGSPTNGQLLRANASGDLEFVNSNQITKNIGTVNLETSDTTRTLKIAEDGHLNIIDQNDASIFYIDEQNKRVGINTTTLDKPAALFINGDALFKNGSTIGVEGSQSFTIGKIGPAAGVATVNVTGDFNVTGNCTIDTNLKFGSAGNQLLAYPGTFVFGRNGSSTTSYQFNGDVTNVSFENTGDVSLKNASGLKIFNGSTNNIAIQAPTLSGSYTLTLPTTSGTDGHVLKTDGSGTTSWVDVTAVSDAILDADFSNEDSGLMKKTGAGTYAIATADTDYQSVLPDGPFQTGDKDKLDYITVNADVNLNQAVFTTTSDVSSAQFVDTDDTFDSATDNLVPSQLAVKTYVDSHVKTAIYSDASDNPQLAAGVTAGEVRTLIGAIDDYTVTQSDVTQHLSGGTGINVGSDGVISSTVSGGATSLNGLSDTAIVSPAQNDYLVYNGSVFTDQQLDISHDTTPTLGGDLVVSGNKIKATGPGQHVDIETDTNNIRLTAAGEIDLTPGSGNHINAKGDLDMSGNAIVTTQNNNDITLTPDGTGQINLGTYPIKADDTAPDSGDNLKVLTYVHGDSEIRLVSNPQGTVTTNGTSASTRIATFTATTNQISGQSDGFTFDGSGFTTPNVLVEEGTLSAPGRYGSGARVTRTMFTDANANKTAGDVYVMNSSASVWTDKADADAASTASGLLAVAASTQSAAGMVLSGIVRMSDNTNFVNADKGDILYLDTVAGHVTATKPTGSSKVVRVVGYVVDPGVGGGTTNDGVIYFDPSKDWIELNS
jgi:hypothetical protein